MEFQTTLLISIVSLSLFIAMVIGQLSRERLNQKHLLATVTMLVSMVLVSVGIRVYGELSDEVLGLSVFTIGGIGLYRKDAIVAVAAGIGLTLASTSYLLQSYGLPYSAALFLVMTVALLIMFAVLNKRFLYLERIQEEVILLVLLASLLMAIAPTIQQGWSSAQLLNVEMTSNTSPSDQAFTTDYRVYGLSVLALCCGVCASLLKLRSPIEKGKRKQKC